MSENDRPMGFAGRVLCGFIAGFFATLIFHQLTLGAMWGLGLAPFKPFSMVATHPFGIPAVFSLAFWGGVWGIPYAFANRAFRSRTTYWVAAFLFGAIFPSLIALVVVLPLKGHPMGGGWMPGLLFLVFLINGAWGIGTAVILRLFAVLGCRT